MTKDEALKQARDALKNLPGFLADVETAIDACDEALAQPLHPLKPVLRDNTEHGKAYYLASDVDALLERLAGGGKVMSEPVAPTPEKQGYVPLSDDGKSVFIDGFGEVPLAYPPMRTAPMPVQEPDYLMDPSGRCYAPSGKKPLSAGYADNTYIKLWAAPPKRPWVGLTFKETQDAHSYAGKNCPRDGNSVQWFADAIEAKLKEKNT